jgi:hypothetical protein
LLPALRIQLYPLEGDDEQEDKRFGRVPWLGLWCNTDCWTRFRIVQFHNVAISTRLSGAGLVWRRNSNVNFSFSYFSKCSNDYLPCMGGSHADYYLANSVDLCTSKLSLAANTEILMSPRMKEGNSDSFKRWQDIAIEQLGSTMNLVLGLSTGLLAFQASLLMDGRVSSSVFKTFAVASVISLLASIGLAVWCATNRLKDFRLTAQIARRRKTGNGELEGMRAETKRLGRVTWRLWRLQIWLFVAGVAFCAASIVVVALAR